MIKLSEAVIVEGKYDKIRLSNIIDATIITTDGFGIFKNEEKRSLIRLLAEKCGIIVITDSDSAGQMIRSHIKNIAKSGSVKIVCLPPIKGKERRKTSASAEGLLGVEGTDDEIIIEALSRAGVTGSPANGGRKITKADLFALGLSGKDNSAEGRASLCRYLKIPNLPANTLLDALNSLFDYDRFMEMTVLWKAEETQN